MKKIVFLFAAALMAVSGCTTNASAVDKTETAQEPVDKAHEILDSMTLEDWPDVFCKIYRGRNGP